MDLRLGSVPVFVSDQDHALEFYRDKLGFEVVADVPLAGGIRWVTVAPRDGATELILFHPAISGDRSKEINERVGTWTGIVLLTEDIHSAHETLRRRGVKFKAEPHPQSWGGLETWFSDPDGNSFHLVQRPESM